MKQNEEYLDCVKNEEETIIEKFLNNWKEAPFSSLFEDVRHDWSFILLLSLTDSDILKQRKVTDDEINIIKNLALKTVHRQKCLKEYFA